MELAHNQHMEVKLGDGDPFVHSKMMLGIDCESSLISIRLFWVNVKDRKENGHQNQTTSSANTQINHSIADRSSKLMNVGDDCRKIKQYT